VSFMEGLSPDAQLVLILCAFSLATMVIMAIFLIVGSRKKTRNLSETIREVARFREPHLPIVRSLDEPTSLEETQDV
jgi:hypothetical protein